MVKPGTLEAGAPEQGGSIEPDSTAGLDERTGGDGEDGGGHGGSLDRCDLARAAERLAPPGKPRPTRRAYLPPDAPALRPRLTGSLQ